MATLMKMPSGLVAHRRWEDIVSMILGAAILVSPMFIEAGLTPTIVAATALAGAAIIVLAALEQLSLRRWEEILELACGVWVMVAPFALNYGGMLRSWHIALGAAVALLAILELWQDRDRHFGM
ncbi:MAG: hypothetical protein ABWY13_08625 [Mesorhizobium sp.]|jgi:hypothetical protein